MRVHISLYICRSNLQTMYQTLLALTFTAIAFTACKPAETPVTTETPVADTLRYETEVHLKNMRQLTFGGDNAEAYWSFDGKSVVFQRTSVKDGVPCDQIFYGKLPKNGEKFSYPRNIRSLASKPDRPSSGDYVNVP